jgi:hypothetical protein
MKPKLTCAIKKSTADFGVSIQHYNKTENSIRHITAHHHQQQGHIALKIEADIPKRRTSRLKKGPPFP